MRWVSNRRARRRFEIGPFRGDERSASIGQDQDQMQSILPMHRSQHRQGFTFKGMVLTKDGDSLGQVLVMGSVSLLPSTPSTTNC